MKGNWPGYMALTLFATLTTGCGYQIATIHIDDDAVTIVLDTFREPTYQQRAEVGAEAELRCGKFGRNAEYVSTRWEYLADGFTTRYTYLYQCVPKAG